MLIIDGFLENGVFIPNKPIVDVKGRQSATLTVSTNDYILITNNTNHYKNIKDLNIENWM